MKAFEIEKKYRLSSPQRMRRLLKKIGARKKSSGRELNQFWDCNNTLFRQKMALRLRLHGKQGTLTLKGPRQPQRNGADKRLEIETPVNFKAVAIILKASGFRLRLEYSKKRELYAVASAEITIDHLEGHGWFLEIEGSLKIIDGLEKKLGLSVSDREPRSYLALVEGR